MSKLRAVFLLAVTATLLMIANLPEATKASCWKTWSRCTEWSHFFTGKIWTKCDPYCKCLGRSGVQIKLGHVTVTKVMDQDKRNGVDF